MRAAVEAAKTAVAKALAPLIEAAQRELEEATGTRRARRRQDLPPICRRCRSECIALSRSECPGVLTCPNRRETLSSRQRFSRPIEAVL